MASATSSDYLHQAQMNFLLKGTAWTPPGTLYVALFTTLPALNGTGGVEVSTSGTNYARMPIAQNSGWAGPDASLIYSNADDIVFGVPSADWGTILGAGLYDVVSGAGNLFYVSQLTTSKVVSNGDGAPKILAGQLRILRASC